MISSLMVPVAYVLLESIEVVGDEHQWSPLELNKIHDTEVYKLWQNDNHNYYHQDSKI